MEQDDDYSIAKSFSRMLSPKYYPDIRKLKIGYSIWITLRGSDTRVMRIPFEDSSVFIIPKHIYTSSMGPVVSRGRTTDSYYISRYNFNAEAWAKHILSL